jgi:triphosphatase
MRFAREFAFDLGAHDDAWLMTKLAAFGAIRKGSVRSRMLYLDTPEGTIARLGLGLGLQQRDPMVAAAQPRRRGVAGRKRWTRFVEALAPTPQPRAQLEAHLRDDATREALALAATCESNETLYSLQFGASALELRYDRSEICAADRDCVVATVTLRHVAGDVSDFAAAVRAIATSAELLLCAEAAMTRAWRHFGMDAQHHVGASSPRLGRAMDVGVAFKTIARTCFDQFLRNETAVRELRDLEAVHQCRVALRRLRAALRLFKLNAGNDAGNGWRQDLKYFSALLRDARDLDVLISEQIEPRLAVTAVTGSNVLLNDLERRRHAAYGKLVEALKGAEAKRFYLEVALWIEAGDFGAPHLWSQTLVAFVHKRLSKQTRKLLLRGKRIEEDNEHERHRTRIAAKNLRYSAEFFECLLSGKTPRRRFTDFISALKKIQEILGNYQDQTIAGQVLARLADEPHGCDAELQATLTQAAQNLTLSASAVPEADFLRKANHAFKRLADAKPFWVKFDEGSSPSA